ncbi:hypothetical protein Gotri_024776 [Gossypium trilobum]|uniref:Uncharacterized protein n=1 Tax=Gossypium trilobum TaxID=34281 RepID=A0A7J9DND8_9ROSI|nr:hypothetical protein [Gossypium trilobum]
MTVSIEALAMAGVDYMNGVWISKSGKTMMIRTALLRTYLPKRMKRNRRGLWNKAPESSAPAPQAVVRKMMLVENASIGGSSEGSHLRRRK